MNVALWDYSVPQYKLHDTALVEGVECIVLSSEDGHDCTQCPAFRRGTECKPGKDRCEESLGRDGYWVPLHLHLVSKLKGEACG